MQRRANPFEEKNLSRQLSEERMAYPEKCTCLRKLRNTRNLRRKAVFPPKWLFVSGDRTWALYCHGDLTASLVKMVLKL